MQMRKQTTILALNFPNLTPSGFLNSGKIMSSVENIYSYGKEKPTNISRVAEY